MTDKINQTFGSIAASGIGTSAISSGPGVTSSTLNTQIENSTFYAARQSPPSSESGIAFGSDRKRGRRSLLNDENTLDDILGQLTSKLTTLLTTEDEKREELINAFIDVLGSSRTESSFYLESTNWELEPAVILWLENNQQQQGASRYSYNDHQPPRQSTVDLSDLSGPHHSSGINKRYKPRQVLIQGLPAEWMAIVNANNGIVQFRHIPTGFVQSNVPPGFADLLPGEPEVEVDSWGMPKSAFELPDNCSSNINEDDEEASNACVDGTEFDLAGDENYIPGRFKFNRLYGSSSSGANQAAARESYVYAANSSHASDYSNVFGDSPADLMVTSSNATDKPFGQDEDNDEEGNRDDDCHE